MPKTAAFIKGYHSNLLRFIMRHSPVKELRMMAYGVLINRRRES